MHCKNNSINKNKLFTICCFLPPHLSFRKHRPDRPSWHIQPQHCSEDWYFLSTFCVPDPVLGVENISRDPDVQDHQGQIMSGIGQIKKHFQRGQVKALWLSSCTVEEMGFKPLSTWVSCPPGSKDHLGLMSTCYRLFTCVSHC